MVKPDVWGKIKIFGNGITRKIFDRFLYNFAQLFLSCTVKPLYSEWSRDPKKCSLYGGVHPRGVRYVHAHMCLKYNVHIFKLFRPCLRDSLGGRAIFHEFSFLFIFYDFCLCTVYVFLIVHHSSSTQSSRLTSHIS